MAAYFEMDVKATRPYWYQDSSEWNKKILSWRQRHDENVSIHLSHGTNLVLWPLLPFQSRPRNS